jgi:hypothetical protein
VLEGSGAGLAGAKFTQRCMIRGWPGWIAWVPQKELFKLERSLGASFPTNYCTRSIC